MHIQALTYNKRIFIFWTLLAVLVSSFVLYTYLLNKTILNVVDRKTAERSILDTTAHISELESNYMALSAAVTPELARSLGFMESKEVVFAQKTTYMGFAKLGE